MKSPINAPVKTILTIITGLIIFYFIFKSAYFLYTAVILGSLSLLFDRMTYYIHSVWMMLARLMSYIMPNVLMGLLFYLILTPIAMLQRIFKKNRSVFLKDKSKSTFIRLNRSFNKESFDKPW